MKRRREAAQKFQGYERPMDVTTGTINSGDAPSANLLGLMQKDGLATPGLAEQLDRYIAGQTLAIQQGAADPSDQPHARGSISKTNLNLKSMMNDLVRAQRLRESLK